VGVTGSRGRTGSVPSPCVSDACWPYAVERARRFAGRVSVRRERSPVAGAVPGMTFFRRLGFPIVTMLYA